MLDIENTSVEPEIQLLIHICRRGAPVYCCKSSEVEKTKIKRVIIDQSKTIIVLENRFTVWIDDIGKNVFLTRKEAEIALGEINNY